MAVTSLVEQRELSRKIHSYRVALATINTLVVADAPQQSSLNNAISTVSAGLKHAIRDCLEELGNLRLAELTEETDHAADTCQCGRVH